VEGSGLRSVHAKVRSYLKTKLGVVVHIYIYNPTYLGGRARRIVEYAWPGQKHKTFSKKRNLKQKRLGAQERENLLCKPEALNSISSIVKIKINTSCRLNFSISLILMSLYFLKCQFVFSWYLVGRNSFE
jgi:hypothetical protein